MLTQIILAVGLCAVGAEPAAKSAPRPFPASFQENRGADGGYEGSAGCASCGSRSCCGPYSFRCHFFTSPCDMHQRMPYWNKERGYYYFHPYHVGLLNKQQERVANWGREVSNPYDNRFLDKIHDEWEAEEELKRKHENIEPLPIDAEKSPSDKALEPAEEEVKPGNTPAAEDKAEDAPKGARKPSKLKSGVKFGFSQP